jgi:ubiquinone/menaquinone biosynthesis C-methylase UbiE
MLAHGAGRYERFMRSRKARLLRDAGEGGGTVLEIGAGTGVNIEYLPRDIGRYIAVEPNPFMHRHLRRAARDRGVQLDLRAEPFEAADIEDFSVDAVVCTLVLCSVADPAAVVRRIQRILRPGGKFIFIEHVAAPRGTGLRRIQLAIRPVWRVLGDGCHPDRETEHTISEAGFEGLSLERFRANLPVVSPHIAGVARTARSAEVYVPGSGEREVSA